MGRPAAEVLDSRFDWLEGRTFNSYSQYGEDGLIEACLERFGTSNKWCFEVGAHDGVYFSNVKKLWDSGWDAVLIEGDADHYKRCCRFESGRVRCINEYIGLASLDRILEECGAPKDLDFGVIDVDGQDYWILQGLQIYRPRLLLVEFGLNNKKDMVSFIPSLRGKGQAPFGPIKELGESKGYVAMARTHVNILFCAKELL